MVVYTVSVFVDTDAEAEWLSWMRETHIPEVLATGYFESAEIGRILDAPDAGHRAGYAISYRCDSLHRLRDYQSHSAPTLQADHNQRFAGRFAATRTVVELFERTGSTK